MSGLFGRHMSPDGGGQLVVVYKAPQMPTVVYSSEYSNEDASDAARACKDRYGAGVAVAVRDAREVPYPKPVDDWGSRPALDDDPPSGG